MGQKHISVVGLTIASGEKKRHNPIWRSSIKLLCIIFLVKSATKQLTTQRSSSKIFWTHASPFSFVVQAHRSHSFGKWLGIHVPLTKYTWLGTYLMEWKPYHNQGCIYDFFFFEEKTFIKQNRRSTMGNRIAISS